MINFFNTRYWKYFESETTALVWELFYNVFIFLSPRWQAETPQLQDPLLSCERKRSDEDRVLFRCMTGSTLTDRDLDQVRLPPLPLVPLGRHGTDCHTWLEMPMGQIESPVRLASRYGMDY